MPLFAFNNVKVPLICRGVSVEPLCPLVLRWAIGGRLGMEPAWRRPVANGTERADDAILAVGARPRDLCWLFMPKEECARKMALLVDVQAAMGALMAIHNEEVAALLREDFDGIAQLRTKLQAAREHKASLIELYREHVTSHGC